MFDILNNEINIGDKIIFPVAYSNRKELDYGIVEKLSKNGKSCWCKSFRNQNFTNILRKSYQVVKLG